MAKPHKHLLFDASINKTFESEEAVKAFFVKVIEDIGMIVAKLTNEQPNPIAWDCQDKDNEGMTAVGILTTSHIILHIWDKQEVPEIHFDLYSCSDFDMEQVLQMVHEQVGLVEGHGHLINRRGYDLKVFDFTVINNKVVIE